MSQSIKIRLRNLALALLAFAPFVAAAAEVPAFSVQALGVGVPVDVNSIGAIVGQDGYVPSQPWVLSNGVKQLLPLPAGATTATVSRINEQGVVVGQATDRPAIWRTVSGSYQLQLLALPPGATIGSAVDANAAGQVLLSIGTPTRLVTGLEFIVYKPYLYTMATGQQLDLTTVYTVAEASFPDAVDIDDHGRILTASGEILEPDFTVTPAPAYPPRPPGGPSWIAFRAARLADTGAFVGRATLSTSQGYAQVVRYVPGAGWTVLGGLSANVAALGIDAANDTLLFANYVCASNYGIAYAPGGGGSYCLDDLLLDTGWSFLSYSARGAIAADGRIAGYGYNTATGTYRLALLTPAGPLPVPPAVNLSALAHPGTYTQPWDAITLNWASAGALAKQYAIERRDPGTTAFLEIARVTATLMQYDDQAIQPLASYAYRVRAIGLAGPGPYSNEATATAPPAMDRVSPGVTITAPLEGATVTGTVTVSATFTDNVAVTFTRLEYQPNMGNGIICDRYPAAGSRSVTVSCKWDTTKVAYQSPTATLIAYAQDAIGNWSQKSITVNVTYSKKPRTR